MLVYFIVHASSEQRNLHLHCPEGPNSWCRFNKDRANQTNIYKPDPGLPLNVIAELKPVYERLSEDDLLARCLDGRTQNQNESLNGMIWERVPKDVFIGSETLQLGVYDAVAHFNIGSKAAVNILHQLGLEPGEFCLEEFKMADITGKKVKFQPGKLLECRQFNIPCLGY